MRVQNSLQDPCPICGKETTLAVIEPHPTHPERELHTYRVPIAGRSKLRRIGDVMGACRERPKCQANSLPRRTSTCCSFSPPQLNMKKPRRGHAPGLRGKHKLGGG